MNTKKAVKEVVNFLTTKPYSKILCISIEHSKNRHLKDSITDLLNTTKIRKEFIIETDKIYRKNDSYCWFCRFVILTGKNSIEQAETLMGYCGNNLLLILNELPKDLEHIYDIAEMYKSAGNKVIEI